MSIVSYNVLTPGLVGVTPRRVQIVATDNLATVTAAGYLNRQGQVLEGLSLSPTDVIDMIYSYVASTNSGTYEVFLPSIASNGVITLNLWANAGDVLLPVTSGDFAVFNGTSGQIKDAGYLPSNAAKTNVVMANGATIANHIATYTDTAGTVGEDAATAINGGNIQAGLSGTAGKLTSFPSTATTGSLSLLAVANAGNFANAISNASTAQAVTWSLADPAGATSNITQAPAALVNNNLVKASGTAGLLADAGFAAANVVQSQSSVANNNVAFTVVKTLGFAALATAGKVNIVTHPSATAQFAVMDIKVFTSTGLSGGGGNRLLAVSDGTIVYNNAGITAALLGTPIFTLWGGTGNPIAVGTGQISTAGADIFFQYTGGTTDYTAGSVIVAVTLVQVTA